MSEVILTNSEAYAHQEMQKLRELYQSALKYRLDIKKKMKDIVLH